MKKLLLCLTVLIGADVAPSHAETFKDQYRKLLASPKELRIHVIDEDGHPLAGALGDSISINPNTGQHGGDDWVADANGLIVCKDPPYFFTTNMKLTLSQAETSIGWKSYDTSISERDFLNYESPQLALKLTLPRVRHPIPLKAKAEWFPRRRVNGPKDKEPADPKLPDLAVTEIGYDAEMLEPMPPYGNGKHIDFTIRMTSTFLGFNDAWTRRSAEVDAEIGTYSFSEGKVRYGNWKHSVTYRFPNKGDGVLLSQQFWPYCKLKMPHKAPEDGYAQEITLTETQDNSGIQPDLAHCREHMVNNGLYLRVRTQLDKDGNVVSAHYAKIVSPRGSGSKFLIFYNPTPNDRNLEYDLKTNLRWQELHPLTKEPMPWDSPYDVRSN